MALSATRMPEAMAAFVAITNSTVPRVKSPRKEDDMDFPTLWNPPKIAPTKELAVRNTSDNTEFVACPGKLHMYRIRFPVAVTTAFAACIKAVADVCIAWKGNIMKATIAFLHDASRPKGTSSVLERNFDNAPDSTAFNVASSIRSTSSSGALALRNAIMDITISPTPTEAKAGGGSKIVSGEIQPFHDTLWLRNLPSESSGRTAYDSVL